MLTSDRISELLSVAGAPLLYLGGASTVLVALLSWLGKVWASRILEREKTELSKSIEMTKAELTRSIEQEKAAMTAFHEEHKAEIQELSSQRLDALNRRRDVYARLATKMRIFLRADMVPTERESDKRAFLAAYDEGYLWATERVAVAIHDLVETMEKKATADANARVLPPNAPGFPQVLAAAQALDIEAQERYRRCLLEMRRDCGFAESAVGYRPVSFA
ncbi:MAG TPA: hypothetical protein VG273_16170 [Bryobacteraceae bacterium]|jgi:hypothetical protein|nr:hypothetical protein [Bryobacteraceae bacterium]